MASPDLELQGAIVARLKGVAALTALIGQRVYDQVPRSSAGDITAVFPFVAIGPSDVLSDDAQCVTGYDIAFQIDCWSRAVGFPEVKKIAHEVKLALDQFALPLPTNTLVTFDHRQTRTFRDPDGLTSHAAMDFRALVNA
jgi:hypothetical protein